MLRIIELFNNLPVSVEVDPDANFQPGHIGSLRIKNGKSLIGICDGLHPFGILDDIKTNKFRCIPKPPTQVHIVSNARITFDEARKEIVLAEDHKVSLNHNNIIAASFTSSVPGHLQPINGVFTLPKGTGCNYCVVPRVNGKDVPYAVRFSCRYAYNVPINSFDDSTASTDRATVWTKNMIAETDMYDTAQEYPTCSLLYASNGLLTTKIIDYNCKSIGVVLEPPNQETSMLRFLLDLDGKVDVGSNNY